MLLLFNKGYKITTCLRKSFVIRVTVSNCRERLSICTCASFPCGYEGGMLDFIVLVADHSLEFYLSICVYGQEQKLAEIYTTQAKCITLILPHT